MEGMFTNRLFHGKRFQAGTAFSFWLVHESGSLIRRISVTAFADSSIHFRISLPA